jgi:DNA-binding response OmpR family regulator
MHQVKVLLVEDNYDLQRAICRYLSKIGFQVEGVSSAAEMYCVLEAQKIDVLLLDVVLPGESGFKILEKIRHSFEGVVIVLSARTDIDYKVAGLNLGADYYLTKPLHMRELEAVILSQWRKRFPHDPGDEWVLDLGTWTLTLPNGGSLSLSASEYHLFAILMKVLGEPVSRADLFQALGRREYGPHDRALDVMISKVRRKVRELGADLPVRSVRNVGYVFSEPARMVTPKR